jgi:sodium/bile acid cotransporter 7
VRSLGRWRLRNLHPVVSVGRLPRLPIDTFVLLLLATVGLAFLVPAQGTAGDVVATATKFAIALLFLLYGVRLSPAEAWHGLRHWRLHLMVLSVTFVVFPLLGLAARGLVPSVLAPGLYAGVLFLCLVPSTVQSSIAFTSIAHGNVSAAIVSASLSNILGVFLSPLLVVALMSTTRGARFDGSAALDIVLQLLAPFVVGQLLRPWLAKWVHRHAMLTKTVDRGSILLVVYAAFSVGIAEHVFSSVTGWQIAAVALVCIALLAVVLVITTAMGRIFQLDRGDAVVLLFCGSKKSLASGLPMAVVLFGSASVGLIVLPLMLFHIIQLLVCAAIAGRMSKAATPD